MAPTTETEALAVLPPMPTTEAEALAVLPPMPDRRNQRASDKDIDEWMGEVDDVSAQIKGIIDGSITDFEALDYKNDLKTRAKQIREEDFTTRRERFFLYGTEGKGEGTRYKWWCKRCFVEYLIDLPNNTCTRCKQSDKMMIQEERRAELMDKLEDYKKVRSTHHFRKDKWLRWKKSQAILKKSKYINYKAWEFWEPDTDTEDEGDPIVPKNNPEFMAMEADIKDRHKKTAEKTKTAERFRQRGNQCMKDGDFVGAIEHYDEGLEYKRDMKALWTNKALAEIKVFRWQDAIASCNKVIEYSEIFEDGFTKSAGYCFKAFVRRAAAMRALHRWAEAVEDLEDALKLFPKDREASDLLEKTRAACQEAASLEGGGAAAATPAPQSAAERLFGEGSPEAAAARDAAETSGAIAAPAPAPSGPVRVEIEESDGEDDEDEDVPVPAAHSTSLAKLSKGEFQALLRSLKQEKERALFCARGGEVGIERREDSRKVSLKKVEEVVKPSRLDEVVRDAERCSVLWKKTSGRVVPLRDDVKQTEGFDAAEDAEAAQFLRVATPRVLAVLSAIAVGSEHHSALTAPAVRHVWPLLAGKEWRYSVLALLLEWSERSLTAKTMAEFAARYPDPHFRLVLDAVVCETKENMLPPGFEERAKQAAQHLEQAGDSGQGMDAAFDDMLAGLASKSASEQAASILGNLCLAGSSLPAFRTQLGAFREELVPALAKQLKPMNWRMCGPCAGAVCNLLRLGETVAATVEEHCTKPLVDALRGEVGAESASSFMKTVRQEGRGGGLAEPATGRLLAALINLLTVRPGAAPALLKEKLMELAVPLLDPAKATAASAGSTKPEDGPGGTIDRARVLVGRLLTRAPGALSLPLEAELLRRLLAGLEGGREAAKRAAAAAAAGESAPAEVIERLELTVRMLAVLVTKTPGALDRLAQRAPRVEEVDIDTAVGKISDAEGGPAIQFDTLVAKLIEIAVASRAKAAVAVDNENGPLSRLRGNLALLFANLCDAQQADGAPPALRGLDFMALVDPLVATMRHERGSVQNNIGVCVTRLAQHPKYKQAVRDVNGMESLHQIQLPRVQAQKAEAERRHRIETSESTQQAELQRLKRERQALRGLD